MIHILNFSGGKDSTAMILWAIEKELDFETVFFDTGLEHPKTYEYIQHTNETLLGGKLYIRRSKKYKGFEDLSLKKKLIPSTKARFFTSELKIKPKKSIAKEAH